MIFISYARSDDGPFARWLYESLTAAGHDVFWDRERMPGKGRTYLHDLIDAIHRTERVLLVTGPRAALSDSVGKEWRFALEHCIAIVPVLRIGERENVPEPLAKHHSVDFRATREPSSALAELLRIVGEPVAPLGPILGVPPLPGHVVRRAAEVRAVRSAVLIEAETNVVVAGNERASAIVGMGGLGKSVLATLFAHSCEARRFFEDGIAWVTLGRAPDLDSALRRFGLSLGVRVEVSEDSSHELLTRLRTRLENAQALVILDDVWDARDTQPFRGVLGSRCQLLVTSRSASVAAGLRARAIPLNALDRDGSLELLSLASGQPQADLPAEAAEIVRHTNGLPLALALVGSMVGARKDRWQHALQRLRQADLKSFENEFPDYPHPSLFAAIDVSVAALEPDLRDFYLDLAVFPRADSFPEVAALRLWQSAGRLALDGETALDKLVKRSLLTHEGDARYRLHDLQRDYVVSRTPDLRALHGRFLDSYSATGDWPTARDDGYLFDHLLEHLRGAGRNDALHDLMCDHGGTALHRWYQARSSQTGVFSFLRDLRAARADATQIGDREIGGNGQAPSIGWSARYTLLEASVRAIASRIPASLVRLYLDRGVVSAAQATDSVLGMAAATNSDAREKVAALLAIASHPKSSPDDAAALREVAYKLVREHDPGWQVWLYAHATQVADVRDLDALRDLLAALPDAGDNAALRFLAVAQARLGRHDQALETLQRIEDEEERGEALHHAMPLLVGAQLDIGLNLARALGKNRDRALVGAAAGLARTGQTERALALSAEIPATSYRAAALKAIGPTLDGVQARRAIELATGIEPFSESVAARAFLSHRLDEVERSALIEDLDRAVRGRFDRDAEYASTAVVPYLDRKAIESRLWLADAHEAVPLLDRMAATGDVAGAIRHLARFEHDVHKRNAIDRLAPRLSSDQVNELLAITDSFSDNHDRVLARSALAIRAAQLGDGARALRIAGEIEPEPRQKDALLSIAPYLDVAELAILRSRIARIADDEQRALAIAQLAPWSPARWLPDALATVYDGVSDVAVFTTILDRMSGVLPPQEIAIAHEALVRGRSGTTYASRAVLLLLPALEPSVRATALRTALSAHWDESDQRFLLEAMVRLLPHLDDAGKARVRAWAENFFKPLLELLPFARTTAHPLARLVGTDAVRKEAGAIEHERHRIGVIASLIPLLHDVDAATVEAEVLLHVRRWENPYDVVIGLGEHARHLTDRLLLEAVRRLRDDCEPENVRTEIAALARRMARNATPEALELLRMLRGVVAGPDDAVIQTTAAIACRLSVAESIPLLQEAVGEVVRLANARTGGAGFKPGRAECLAALCPPLSRLPLHETHALLARMLDGLPLYPRPECATDLAALGPLIFSVGGENAIDQTCTALIDSATWWP